ncbi:leucine efflux protein LeuE [Ralstonia solanacearum]|uniref:leucine efflux protein LeuE n=1 Tax=Ralstonia solanacearum TaxID=305 RepID=UPI0018D17C43|nr:leucine efflux protein LeuE [Ralstonia solanacearum]
MNAFMLAHFGITEFWTFLLGTIFIVLLPGPNSIYVLTVAARCGVRAGYQGACGVFLGDAILMVLSAAGVSSLLKASPAVFYVVKYTGAAYLAWIGQQQSVPAEPGTGTADQAHPFKKALIISLLNPKAILFFISFFIQFVDPHTALPALSFVVLGLVCQVCSFLYLTTIIFVGARLAAAFRARRRLAAGMSSGVGAMFIGFSAKLATATLN